MFFVTLKFSANKHKAADFLEAHKAWLQRGFEDGVFLLAGSLKPAVGGAILAQGTSLADLQDRLQADPFVAEDIVTIDILEIAPSRIDERLAFLAG